MKQNYWAPTKLGRPIEGLPDDLVLVYLNPKTLESNWEAVSHRLIENPDRKKPRLRSLFLVHGRNAQCLRLAGPTRALKDMRTAMKADLLEYKHFLDSKDRDWNHFSTTSNSPRSQK